MGLSGNPYIALCPSSAISCSTCHLPDAELGRLHPSMHLKLCTQFYIATVAINQQGALQHVAVPFGWHREGWIILTAAIQLQFKKQCLVYKQQWSWGVRLLQWKLKTWSFHKQSGGGWMLSRGGKKSSVFCGLWQVINISWVKLIAWSFMKDLMNKYFMPTWCFFSNACCR